MVKVREDLTGRQFGRLTVKRQVEDHIEPSGVHVAQWLCECSCKNNTQIIVNGHDLKRGHTRSCGCIQREWTIESNKINKWSKKYNDKQINLEDEHGLYGIGYCSNTGREFYFDMDDYDKIKDICWYEHVNENGGHRILGYNPENNKLIKMHTLLGCSNYDHEDRNEFNNRKYNLRAASKVEQARNRGRRTTNKSGVTGVCWIKKSNAWQAYINIGYHQIKLGMFNEKKDAIIARLKAEKQYYGEFAPQRHLYQEYGITNEILESRSDDTHDDSAAS